MSGVEIVQASWRDAWALSRLDRKCFSRVDGYSWLAYLSLCTWPGTVTLKAVSGEAIVGVVAGDRRRWRGYILVVTLAVDPGWRRRGIGERLMRACEARFDLPRFRLQVRKSNSSAIRLYRSLGYVITSALPGYYGDGEDAYVMEKVNK